MSQKIKGRHYIIYHSPKYVLEPAEPATIMLLQLAACSIIVLVSKSIGLYKNIEDAPETPLSILLTRNEISRLDLV